MVQCLSPKSPSRSESLLTTESKARHPGRFKLTSMVLLLSPRTIDRKGKLYKSVVSQQGLLHRVHNRCFFVESFSEVQ